MTVAYIAMGSNQGEPVENIKKALEDLAAVEGIRVTQVAQLYLTEPVGYENQEWFHNTMVEIDTLLSPRTLLEKLQKIEKDLGRVRIIRWGPRTIDLDIIFYGESTIDEPDLQIPHPRLEERAFVLAPLRDLCPGRILPSGKVIEEALDKLDEKKIICIDKKMW